MRELNGQLDILRIVVDSPDDDEVLETSGDITLAAADEAEVAGAEEWPFARLQEPRFEGFSRLLGFAPVPLRDARPRDPDLANPVVRTPFAGFGIGNHNPGFSQHMSRTDQSLRLPRAVFVDGGNGILPP